MDRRITRSLASRSLASRSLASQVKNVQPEPSSSVLDNGKGRKRGRKESCVSKYHYEIDMWGRKKRVPNRDHSSKQAKQEVENMAVTSSDHVHQSSCAQGEEVTSKQRTRTSSTSSPRKRKASQSTSNNLQAKMDGGVIHTKIDGGIIHTKIDGGGIHTKIDGGIIHTKIDGGIIHTKIDVGITGSGSNNLHTKMDGGVTGSGRQSSNAHQRNSCSHPQAKVNSNSISQPDGQVVVKKERSERNHCLKQQSEQQQQLVPKSSSRSSTNRNNQVVSNSNHHVLNEATNNSNHHVLNEGTNNSNHHVLNEGTNISKQPGSNKMIPVTITITSDSSEVSERKERQQEQMEFVHRQLSSLNQNNHLVSMVNNTMLSHLDLPSSSNRVMMNTEVGTTGIATGSSPSVSSFDDEDIPEASVDFPKGILSTIKCNGCNKDFFTLDHVPKSDYYFHCFQCPEYCNKNETSRCYDCYSYFIDNESKERHYNLFHSVKANKPAWMPPSMYTKSTLHRSNARIECRGCSEPFGCFVSPISQSSTPSLEYYIHCIEDCSDYKRLQLIATCNTCGFKFMESKSLAGHKPHCSRIFEKGLNLSSSSTNSCYQMIPCPSNPVPTSLIPSLHAAVSNLNHYHQQSAPVTSHHR